jgi:DNA-directed RNA polymerase II subunit RPB1
MSLKRKLTPEELADILNIIKLNPLIPQDIAECNQQNSQNVLKSHLSKIEIYPSCIPELKRQIEYKYLTTKVAAGSMVGALSATSIGEPMTQLVLNSFHSSGIAKSNVTTGVPRMEELLNVTSTTKMCGMRVYFKDEDHTDVVKLRNLCKENIDHVIVNDILKSKKIIRVSELDKEREERNISKQDWEDWHDYYSLMVSEDYTACNWAVFFEVDKTKLYQIKKTLTDVADIITSFLESELYSVSSDENTGLIITYINVPDLESIKTIENKKYKNEDSELFTKSYITEENKEYYYIRDIILDELLEYTISGIVGVSECIYDQPPGVPILNGKKTWIVNTRGSNFREMLNHPLVDNTRTKTSKLKEIEEVLGIEAARNFLIEEFVNIVGCARRHLDQLVNCMTFSGKVKAANRHGIKSGSVLAKISFEEPMKNIIKAAMIGEIDKLEGVTGQLMLGQTADIGTGYVKLMTNYSNYKCNLEVTPYDIYKSNPINNGREKLNIKPVVNHTEGRIIKRKPFRIATHQDIKNICMDIPLVVKERPTRTLISKNIGKSVKKVFGKVSSIIDKTVVEDTETVEL